VGNSKERLFLRAIKGKPYLVHRYTDSAGRRHDQTIPISDIERETLVDALRIKEQLASEIVEFPCMNPHCHNTVRMTKRQMEEFFVSSKKRYDMVIYPFCSTECRDAMLKRHADLKTDD
jgi:hypothetical protein